MTVFRDGESYIFALTYGPAVQWVKNALAAGEADPEVRRMIIHLVDLELFVDPTRRLMPLPVRLVLWPAGDRVPADASLTGCPELRRAEVLTAEVGMGAAGADQSADVSSPATGPVVGHDLAKHGPGAPGGSGPAPRRS